MANEILSSDELNALLNNEEDYDDVNEKINIKDYMSDFELDAIGEIGNISFGSASTALSALLNQKVEITTPVLKTIYSKKLPDEFPVPHVSVHVNYLLGFTGTNLFVLQSLDAKIIADLMLGGNGQLTDDGELTAMEISAVQEAMNQMMGSSATSLSTIFNRIVSISPPGVNVLDIKSGKGNEYLPEEDILIIVSFKMKIGDLIDSNIMQIISIPFAKVMIDYLIVNANDSEPLQETEVKSPENVSEAINEQKEIVSSKLQEDISKNQEYEAPPLKNVETKVNVQSVQFSELESKRNVKTNDSNLGILMDIPLQISVELGRTKKMIKDILELSSGSIIELDKLAGEPVDIYANNKLIAKGEVVVIDENFGVRITDIISQIDRVKRLQ
ncbi:MAG: flagellar motor switch phosphatase FliY [Vulcanibacillus sp.]